MSELQIALPFNLISPVDLNRVLRELKNLDDFLAAAASRQPGTASSLPRTTLALDEMAKAVNVNLLDATARASFQAQLAAIKQTAPIIHISFAADPNMSFLQKIIEYLRREIHPQLLLQVGLQPSIGAGCVVRTPNHYFDFSLRKRLQGDRDILISSLKPGRDDGHGQ